MHEGHHDAPAGKGIGRRDSLGGASTLPFADDDRDGAAARAAGVAPTSGPRPSSGLIGRQGDPESPSSTLDRPLRR